MRSENPALPYRSGRFPRLAAALAAAAACLALGLFFTSLYDEHIDNYYIALVVNGLFDDGGRCQLIHPLLAAALRAMSRLLPSADVFMLTAHVLVFLELFWLMNLLLRERKGIPLSAAGFLLLALASLDLKLFNGNFTVQAASFAMTGMISILYAQRRADARACGVVGALFFAAGFMWRRNAALLALPYLLLDTVFNVFSAEDRPRALKRSCLILAPCLLLTAVLVLADAAMYADETDRLARQYDTGRARIVDYPIREWEEISESAQGEGITETDYYAARNWLLFDTERMDAARIRIIAELGRTTAFPPTARGLLDAARSAKATLVRHRLGIALAVLSLFALAALPGPRRVEILACCLGTLAILLYFVMLGHTPGQFWYSALLLPLGLVVFDLILEEKGAGKRYSGVLFVLFLLFAVWRFAALAPELEPIRPQPAIRARTGPDESEYAELLESDGIYVWAGTGGALWEVEPVMRQGKLVSENFVSHLVDAGHWTYGQPYFAAYLKRLGIPDPAAALAERADVFLVADRPELALSVIGQRAGAPVTAEPVGTVRWFTVYAISADPGK